VWAEEPMARVPKTAHSKFSLTHGIHCSPKYFISFVQPASPYCEEYLYDVYTQI
jgi:hypothetical protein